MDDKENQKPAGSPEAPKPPYESPIKYEIRNMDQLWQRYQAVGTDFDWIGPKSDHGIEPALEYISKFGEPNIAFSLYGYALEAFPSYKAVKETEARLKEHVADNLRFNLK